MVPDRSDDGGARTAVSADPDEIRRIADLLKGEAFAACARGVVSTSPGGATLVDGVPWWTWVASLAHSLGARCERDGELHGPVTSLSR